MAMRILWPNLPAEFHQIARDAVGSGFETDFCASAAEVSDEQWANADAKDPKGAAVRIVRRGYRDATIADPFPGADSGVGDSRRQSFHYRFKRK